MTALNDRRVRAEIIALNARQIELAILRLVRRLDAGEVVSYGLADSRKVFAKLAARYEAAARSGGRQRNEDGPSEPSRATISAPIMSLVGKPTLRSSPSP